MTPLIQPTEQGLKPNTKCYYWRGFLRKLVNHEETAKKDFQRTCTVADVVFEVACAYNSEKAKTVCQAWKKLWPAVMTADGASDEEGFEGFYVRKEDTFHEIVSMFEKLDPSNTKCEERVDQCK
jgi:DDE superfamily endonuclease.